MTDIAANETSGYKSFSFWTVLAAIVITLDQVTKWMILKWVPLYEKVPVNSFINITHQRNSGAAFSFLADAAGWQRWSVLYVSENP